MLDLTGATRASRSVSFLRSSEQEFQVIRPIRLIRPILSVAFGGFAAVALVVACSGTSITGSNDPSSFGDASGQIDPGQPSPSDPDGQPIFDDDAGPSSAPPEGSPEYKCYKATTKKACRGCCTALHPAGRKVFTDAIDRCLCQPSKCGTACAATFCRIPRNNLQPTSDCSRCIAENKDSTGNLDDAGVTDAPPSEPSPGSAYPELGIRFCKSYGDILCRNDTECVLDSQCANNSECSKKK
jgi:hypothetical protein